ncbi:MAG TPA: PilZ domain-containing protein [Thermoanaerobaculia bacterium]|nr:PilZ domain-containing protein [Thermoanaerobaculia bacterium]
MLQSSITVENSPAVERRRYGRIVLDTPLTGRFGEVPIRILDISLSGFRIAHESLLSAGHGYPFWADWDGKRMALDCRVVRTNVWRLAKAIGERSIYHSGLEITHAIDDSYDVLRELITHKVMRALDEQRANAHGIPPFAAHMHQEGKSDLYRRCEYVDGVWRKRETIRPEQPPSGFTVSIDVTPNHLEMLCSTWEQSNAEGRRLTRLLAELSVSKKEGVPTRRYIP